MTAIDEDPRGDWLERRRQGIGGSDAAAVVGLHPWLSAVALYFDKAGELTADSQPTEAMEWGIRLEPVVADKWQENHDHLHLRKHNAYDLDAFYMHPEHPWMVANLDGIVLRDGQPHGVYEGKTASGWSAAIWDEGVPPHVVVQVQHQLAVTGLDVGYVACLIGGSRYVEDEIGRDDELIGALIEAEAKFWDRVQRRDMPPADGHESTTEALKARFRESLDLAVELGDEGLQLVKERHHAKGIADAASTAQAAAENRLRQLLGEAEIGTVFGEIAVTWKASKTGVRRLNVKEVA